MIPPVLWMAVQFGKGALAFWIVFAALVAASKVQSVYRIVSATLDFLALKAETRRDCQSNVALVAKRERR